MIGPAGTIQAPKPAAEQAERKTWTTIDGRKCKHCGKGIIDHAGQVYCPVRA